MKKKLNIKEIQKEMKGFLEKAKVGLKKVGTETSIFAKRSEKELAKLTRAGKAEIDILNLNIKKNRLYYELGKRVYQLSARGKLSTRGLKKSCENIAKIEKGLKGRKSAVSKFLKGRKK